MIYIRLHRSHLVFIMTDFPLGLLDKIFSYIEETSIYYNVIVKDDKNIISKEKRTNYNTEVKDFILYVCDINCSHVEALDLVVKEIKEIKVRNINDYKNEEYYLFSIVYIEDQILYYQYCFTIKLEYNYYCLNINDFVEREIMLEGIVNIKEKTVYFDGENDNILNHFKLIIVDTIKENIRFKSYLDLGYPYDSYWEVSDPDNCSFTIEYVDYKLGKPPLSKYFIV